MAKTEKMSPVWSIVFYRRDGCFTTVIGHRDGPTMSRSTAQAIAQYLMKKDKTLIRVSDMAPSHNFFHELSQRQEEILGWNTRKKINP